MNKVSILLFVFNGLLFLNTTLAQKETTDISNVREGERVEFCSTHKKMMELEKNPEFKKSRLKTQAELQKKIIIGEPIEKSTIFKIPIVFHILHNNGVENISDDQIADQLAILNRDFRLQNLDANDVQPEFKGMPTDVGIEFVMATKAPNGTCFKGITRTINEITHDGTDGEMQVNAIIQGNNVYKGEWPGDKYLNVFVVANAGSAAGYTRNPSVFLATSMQNGIWIMHDYISSIGTGSIDRSRALTHEVGHWLDLNHPWGDNNNPGNTSSCSTDDDVEDTPNCIGVKTCDLNANTCTSIDPYFGKDMKDNVENYMDYSYCSKMFTKGQVTRMRASLLISNTGRLNIWQAENLESVGANGNLNLCKAEFTSDKTAVCKGDVVKFQDASYNKATSWNWSFQGGSPANSKEKNPTVTYNTPGTYSVTLTASDGTTSDTQSKTMYIRVLPSSATLPFFEGFEKYTTLSKTNTWEVINLNNNKTFEIDNSRGHSGQKCVKLENFNQLGNNVDELISSPVDLSKVAQFGNKVTLSFRYAYRKKETSDNVKLILSATNNCGDTWSTRRTISNNFLSNLTSPTSWAPTSPNDWTTVHVTNILYSSNSTYNFWVDNFRYKFQFEANGGNNLFLDDINVYYGNPSENLILLGMNENAEIFPNPAENELNVQFSLAEPEKVVIQLSEVNGKTVETQQINAESGANLVLLSTANLSSGTYLMTIKTQNSQKVLPFIIR
jgi:PKD repeat protein